MQFAPGTWASMGVDCDADGRADIQLAKRVPKQPGLVGEVSGRLLPACGYQLRVGCPIAAHSCGIVTSRIRVWPWGWPVRSVAGWSRQVQR
jgi:hypothetical protein